VVSVRQVSKRYGALTALEAVSFEAGPGEALALWGPNGAGKTTLLKAVLGLIGFEGQIRVCGRDVRRAGKVARRSIGYVPQEVVFYDLSVQATMEFYARLKQVSPARIPRLLERLGLAEHAWKPVPALSGGLKQRLALALALLADPPVLLLDEPTANLDTQAQRDYLALLRTLRQEERKTLLFASHRLEEVAALASRVLTLERGRVTGLLSPREHLARLAPDVELTLWVGEAQRPAALACLTAAGLAAHVNGRGTVVVRVPAGRKMQPLRALQARSIEVLNFEMERGGLWN
jgi:ABC-type multidrug transport system ATPase subunit